MLVSLYTVRVILEVMGVLDYGIYNVVAGIVTMFSFLSGAMATASQRFFSFELGREDHIALQEIFSMSVNIYAIAAAIVFIVAETAGLWFVEYKLIIPQFRMSAARWIYQFSIAAFLISIISTPYLGVIIARENMDVYAYVSIVEATLKLIIVFLVKYSSFDKLKFYGALMLVVTGISSTIYIYVCRKRYPESRYKFFWDRGMFKTLSSYTGWNLFGASVNVVKNQATNILLNLYFGPVVNAARSIAAQVNAAVKSFSQNFTTAVRPQIIKQYAVRQNKEMMQLVFRSSKLTAFLMYIFILPLFLEMPTVIHLWLGQVPPYVVLFTRLVLIDALIDSISYPLMTAAQATGKIKLYQFVVGGVLLLNLPFSYFALEMRAQPEGVLIIAIVITALAFFLRLVMLKRVLFFSIREYIIKTVLPTLKVFLFSIIIPLVFQSYVDSGIFRLISLTMLSSFSTLINIFLFGLSQGEQTVLLTKTKCLLTKMFIKA
jgi:O-antigen/teichoic acid export membrane protein